MDLRQVIMNSFQFHCKLRPGLCVLQPTHHTKWYGAIIWCRWLPIRNKRNNTDILVLILRLYLNCMQRNFLLVWFLLSITASGIHARVLEGGKFDCIIRISLERFCPCYLSMLLISQKIMLVVSALGYSWVCSIIIFQWYTCIACKTQKI